MNIVEINFVDIKENKEYLELINSIVYKCYEIENLLDSNLCINLMLTNNKNIRKYNKTYRNIDDKTDCLSFPMFNKNELTEAKNMKFGILGDIIISIEKVEEQATQYGHSIARELSYMVVHSFYHLIGYDHINEKDKKLMRKKEEEVLG